MANTITNNVLLDCSSERIVSFTLVSDGTQETDLILYDSSSFSGIDTQNCTLLRLYYSTSTFERAGVKLEFDGSTDMFITSLPFEATSKMDFRYFGGIRNTAQAGRTGDITLTTTNLKINDTITIIMEIRPII